MRYGQHGGYTPAEQERRERLRLGAAEEFAAGHSTREIARELRVHERTVAKWRRAWTQGGREALRSRGPVSQEKLSAGQWARLEAELKRGPLAHGFTEDQYWTLSRVKTMIGRLFHIGYTVEGVWRLLRRHDWSCQVPSRQAVERDEEAIAGWKAEVWPQVKEPLRTWAPPSASRTRAGKG
ncbi:winged helix-turn-helix domain-containing protein [Actinomadura sp. ATCC 31491]|uniref:Winged helix-turn-helix domain-containing protein n=1 Tax=Actinomadura luzonensis TaxID=2805427 RepID=A0ABT0FVU7_9ACTN|nr:winged helix-turn-helix domain-containing protein [Actinomadura luzonensis]MCK2216374.1 winged helix-turn-helix domain-containing protein [Actinomadura luzonensis]